MAFSFSCNCSLQTAATPPPADLAEPQAPTRLTGGHLPADSHDFMKCAHASVAHLPARLRVILMLTIAVSLQAGREMPKYGWGMSSDVCGAERRPLGVPHHFLGLHVHGIRRSVYARTNVWPFLLPSYKI